ncbi:winged helix-turn-helix transcriptional regulator [Deinococcus lacus]|uniref:Winged helix-turn-helix transcriptional regulator n=1 Tax=Deinococcus lacus TaxID=392561 RepID=A0ABW1YDC5_9DEIO
MSTTSEFCPIYRATCLLQEKWVLHIVRALLEGEKGFNELARAVGGCNSATLTQRLERLEALGIVSKRLEGGSTRLGRSVYALTASGQELQAVIQAISGWALNHLPVQATETGTGCQETDGAAEEEAWIDSSERRSSEAAR